jgi:cytidylate kinase
MSSGRLIIAIDGPSGAGKGTVARAVAIALDYRHVDTGGMYRAVAWKALRDGIDLSHEEAVAAIAESAAFDLAHGMFAIDGHDVTRAIRTPEMDAAAAAVARLPKVRAALVERQRAYGRDGGIVMEGRDIGTVVFPAADVKLYLDASPEERARRRSQDPSHAAGRDNTGVAVVAEALAARDQSDRTRSVSPLARAADALYIDTTSLSVEEVVARALAAVAAESQKSEGKSQK